MKDLYLAGGPFYGIQEVFSRVENVVDTVAGYANSQIENPTKEQVESGEAGAVECVKVTYNPKRIDICALLQVFFTIVNPYTDGIQGKCKGPQYRTGVYYTSREDAPQISYYMLFIQNRGNNHPISESCMVMNEFEGERQFRPPVRTEMKILENFYPAPEDEQFYLRKHPDVYSPIDIQLLEQLKVIKPLG